MLSGIAQGSRTAALCFLLFINDLPHSIIESFGGLFCDDTLIGKKINSPSDSQSLQHDLDRIHEWTTMWGMNFNVLKCFVMTVSNKRKTTEYDYHLNGNILTKKESIKYLGVTIDNKLTFKQHIEQKCHSATNILNMLRRNLYFAPISVKTKAYMSCVRPIVEYAASCCPRHRTS